MPESAVQLLEVTKRFGAKLAVDSLCLDVREHEFLAILGPSGCGKTTTLRMIAGLSEPDGGQIVLRGRDMKRVPAYRRDIGLVFQDYALFPHLTVAENIRYGLRMRRVPRERSRERVSEMLSLVGLSGYEARRPGELSGGEKQRVALARAIAVNPGVLLLDEPLSNLDARLRHDLRFELKRIHVETGITTIFVTHDQAEALSLADRVIVMNGGHIEQEGSPAHLYDRPVSRFVATFLGDANILLGAEVGASEEGRLVPSALTSGLNGSPFLMVRPENIRVADRQAMTEEVKLAVYGEVVGKLYFGATTRYRIRLAPDREIVADMRRNDGQEYQVGAAVAVTWEPTDCISLRG